MKLAKVAKYTTFTLMFFGAWYCCDKNKQAIDARREYYKSEVLKKDTLKYIELANRNLQHYMSDEDWANELKKINDSLKVDSMVRKAYFEGAQMVRDSIAHKR